MKYVPWEKALKALTPRQREALEVLYRNPTRRPSVAQIAGHLGRPVKAVDNSVRRGHDRLLKLYPTHSWRGCLWCEGVKMFWSSSPAHRKCPECQGRR